MTVERFRAMGFTSTGMQRPAKQSQGLLNFTCNNNLGNY